MKKLFFASLALAATLAGPAMAADMPLKAPPPVYFNWTGLYFGGSIGGAWSRFDEVWPITDHNFLAGTALSFNPSAVTFDAHIGYQWQWDHLVIGAEIDGNWYYNMFQQQIFPAGPIPCTFGGANGNGAPCGAELRVNWSAEAVGKLGWAFDRWMVYAKGGWGVVDMTTREVQCCNPLGFVGNPFLQVNSGFQHEEMQGAPVVGGGFEYAWTDRVFVGVDYKHYFVHGSIRGTSCGFPTTLTLNGGFACGAPTFFQSNLNNGTVDVVAARISFRPFWDTYETPAIHK
jgi:outer membrane immunogenic protein